VRRDCNNGGGGGSNELVNCDFPHSSLIYSFQVMERGLRRGARSGNGSPLTGREIAKLPHYPWVTVKIKR
jgi:hypothetical protein